jgi:hypothetical protein
VGEVGDLGGEDMCKRKRYVCVFPVRARRLAHITAGQGLPWQSDGILLF